MPVAHPHTGAVTKKARVIWAAVVVAAIVGAAGLYWFQPWRLFTNSTVNEALPSAAPTTQGSPDASATPSPPPPQNVLLATGAFITHEHETTGTTRLVRLADGRVQLTLENLATSDGPDLHVWLTDQPVIEGQAGWHVFDDGRYVELGPLKANNGNQVYDVPDGVDLDGLTSVSIWCKRFSVSFGAATLNPV
jgi:hypothetical protein